MAKVEFWFAWPTHCWHQVSQIDRPFSFAPATRTPGWMACSSLTPKSWLGPIHPRGKLGFAAPEPKVAELAQRFVAEVLPKLK